MKYKVTNKFDKETRDAIIRTIHLSNEYSQKALIEKARYSADYEAVVELAKDVRSVRLAEHVLGFEYVSYTEIAETQD